MHLGARTALKVLVLLIQVIHQNTFILLKEYLLLIFPPTKDEIN